MYFPPTFPSAATFSGLRPPPPVETETAWTQTSVAVATRETQTESAVGFSSPLQELALKARALDSYVVPVASLRSTVSTALRV